MIMIISIDDYPKSQFKTIVGGALAGKRTHGNRITHRCVGSFECSENIADSSNWISICGSAAHHWQRLTEHWQTNDELPAGNECV